MEWFRAGLPMEWFRAWVYDRLIINFTAIWYREVLQKLPPDSCVLDVGIGTGTALLRNADLLEERRIKVVGIDYDADYVSKCDASIRAAKLEDTVQVELQSVYDCQLRAIGGGQFDAVYFSGSFMILPDKTKALRQVETLMKPDAKLFFTQTFELKKNPWLETLKPNLSYWTSIDFGSVTYEEDFLATIDQSGFVVEEKSLVPDGKAVEDVRQSVLVVVRRKG